MADLQKDVTLDAPDATAIARLLAVKPMLHGVALAADVVPIGERTLLHAGPPILDRSALTIPLRHSALMAILYEGWATSIDAANRLLDSGAITLRPAQDCNVAVPLADILSPNMSVLVVDDMHAPERRGFSTINGGDGPVMRIGLCNDAVLQRLRWVNQILAPQLSAMLAGIEIDLMELSDRALQLGDDCHGRAMAGSALLLRHLLQSEEKRELFGAACAFLEQAPGFFLNVWMAAVKCILNAAEDVSGSGVVTAIGGNGHTFGIRVAGMPGRWFVTPAMPPLMPGAAADVGARALGAIGDSAIVDAFGCGAMAAMHAPVTKVRLDAVCAEHGLKFPYDLLQITHPAFHNGSDLKTGLTVRRTHETSQTPVISLGVLDVYGQQGRLDGGFYFCPGEPFEQAWHALENGNDVA